MKRPPIFLLLILCLIATRAAADVIQEGDGYTFRLDTSTWTDRPQSVHLAGDFNSWSTTATPMEQENGLWTVTLTDLAEGKRLYKFVVDGERWIPDPTGDKELEEDDGHGGKNSGFIVGPDIRNAPPPRPNHIATEFVLHDPSRIEDASVVDEGKLRLRVRAQADDVEQVFVVPVEGDRAGSTAVKSFYEQRLQNATRLDKVGTARGMDTFVGTFSFEGRDARYLLIVIDGRAKVGVYDGYSYPVDGAVTIQLNERLVPFVRAGGGSFDIPAWAQAAVWYQIFPERFRNGEPDNDPGVFHYENLVPWNSDWWAVLPGETPPSANSDNFYTGAGDVWKRRYGGDIQGIREKLPYMRRLGVTAIYLNPVFEGESMHKYDTADFRHIDDNFGAGEGTKARRHGGTEEAESDGATERRSDEGARGEPASAVGADADYPYRIEGETDDPETWQWSESDRVFLEFLEEAHRQGFKVIIDGVFNHVGRAHPFFIDVLENGPNSRYADWFEILDWGDEKNWRKMPDPFKVHGKEGGIQWVAWDQKNGHLPVFKKDAQRGLAEGPYEHIMAITRRWLDPDGDPSTDDGIDGWRLDVPGDIPHPFWRDWRKVVKETKPDAYIVGEIWNWAQPWLQGDQFDAVMNYQFSMASMDFFINQERAIPPSAFHERLTRITEAYPWPIVLAQQNLMGSHDTDRLASMFVNPDRPYDGANRLQDNARHFDGPPYEIRKPNREEWTRMKQLVAFQHAFVGSPMTYYGDEAGMWGPDDPSNRQPFVWPDKGPYEGEGVGFNEEIFGHFQRCKAIRNALPALQRGEFRSVLVDDERDLYGFVRELDGQIVYVVLNRSRSQQAVELEVEPGRYIDYLEPEQVQIMFEDSDPAARPVPKPTGEGLASDGRALRVRLAPYGTAILVRQ